MPPTSSKERVLFWWRDAGRAATMRLRTERSRGPPAPQRMESLAVEFHKFHSRTRPIIATSLYGLTASLAAVAFQLCISWVYTICLKKPAQGGLWHFAWVSLLVVAASSLIAGWLLSSYCPEAAGSGIPQVKLSFWKEFGYAPQRIAWIKFVAGVISIGGGQSLGREGPTVQIGANLASSLGGVLGVTKQNRRAASAAGAAAGLAAAFNAPLAAIAFVLEEIIGDLNSRFLGAVLLASVIGAFVVHAFIGPQPAFVLPLIKEPTWRAYLLMPFAAALSALAGIVFQRWSLGLRAMSRAWTFPPRWLHPFIGGMLTWIVGVAVFASYGRLGIFGLGYDDLSDALSHGMAWRLAAILLVGKLVVTVALVRAGRVRRHLLAEPLLRRHVRPGRGGARLPLSLVEPGGPALARGRGDERLPRGRRPGARDGHPDHL